MKTIKTFELLDAFIKNRELILKEFYVAQFPKTKYYILKNGGSTAISEDIFQEAFLCCWKKLCTGNFCPKSNEEIEAYLFTISKNKWIDQTRNKRIKNTTSINDKLYQLEAAETNFNLEKNETELQLTITLTAFEKLGQECKDLLTQYYYEKLSLRAIAKKLNMEEASAKNKKYRCIQKLRGIALAKEHTS